MRILLTADPELPVPPRLYGGIERVIDLLVIGLKKSGHTVGLMAHRESTSPADQLFAWPGLQSQRRWDVVRNATRLKAAVSQFQPDVIHSFSRILYMLPQLRSSLPKIMSYQRQPTSITISWAARLANDTITFTGCSDYICREGRLNGGAWHAVHNCVEIEKYTFQSQVSSEAPLVFLSRVERIKGAHTAIEVARRTHRRLLIAGNHSMEGKEGHYWQEEIVPHLGKDGIEYVGPVDDTQKNELLGQAAAMIVPIEWDEPFGIVFAEALACGTPVISCPRGALPEIVQNGVHGFLVNDIDGACAAINQLYYIDRHTCRQHAEQFFAAPVIVDKYEQLYHQLAS